MRGRGHFRVGRDCPRVRHIYVVDEESNFSPTRLFARRGGKEREMQVGALTPRVFVVSFLVGAFGLAQRNA